MTLLGGPGTIHLSWRPGFEAYLGVFRAYLRVFRGYLEAVLGYSEA